MGNHKFFVIFRRQAADANAAVRLQTAVGTHFRYKGRRTTGGVDSPVTHVEIVFLVSCDGSPAECKWRSFATFVRDSVVGSTDVPVCTCAHGTVHTVSISTNDAKSYCARLVVDRAFKDYGCYQIEVGHDTLDRVYDTMIGFVRWSHEQTNRQYNETMRNDEDYRPVSEREIGVYHRHVELAFAKKPSAGDLIWSPSSRWYESLWGIVVGCASQPCAPPTASYNKTGMYWNLFPRWCFPEFGITRAEMDEVVRTGAELRKRPVFCSELVCAGLLLAQIPVPPGVDPCCCTPYDIDSLTRTPGQSVDTNGFVIVQAPPPEPVIGTN
jgi:hypothetical protein